MKYVDLRFSIHEKDIRSLCAQVLSNILSRHQQEASICIEKINKAMSEGTQDEIVMHLKSWLQNHNKAGEEIQKLGNLLDVLDSGRPDTEVLEDLPNLEKDSLGVDDRSEESIDITPHHSKE